MATPDNRLSPFVIHLKRLLLVFGKTFVAFGALWLVLEVVNYFAPGNPIASYRLFGLSIFLVVGIVIGLTWELFSTQRELITAEETNSQVQEQNAILQRQLLDTGKSDSETSLLEELRLAYAQRNWEEVITIGSPLSRPLWLTGRYQLRLYIGHLVEGAAAFSGRFDMQASALIDDLGWTSIALRRYNEGINHLLHGIKVAEDHGLCGLVCRAYRHLSGAYLKLGNIEQAGKYSDKSAEWLFKVENGVEKTQLEAGFAYHRAKELQLRGNNQEALIALISAQEMFVRLSDNDRANKVYGPIGQVYLELGNLASAKDTFRRGLETARLSARRDSELENLIGLAEIAQRTGNIAEAKRMFSEASAKALHLGISDTATELKEKANRLSKV